MSLFPTSARPGLYARVALERGIDDPEGLTYLAPADMEIAVGDRVEAPLGRGDRLSAGYVLEVTTEPGLDPSRIKPIRRKTGVRLPPSLLALGQWIARYYCTPLGMTLAALAPAAVKRGVGATTRTEVEPTGADPPADATVTPAMQRALAVVRAAPADSFPLDPRRLAADAGLRSVAVIKRLVALGVLREVTRRVIDAAAEDYSAHADRRVTLSEAQRRTAEGIVASLGAFHVHLIRGVTGSGKTEVYLRALEATLARGEGAIVLVPEISLTPQTAGRFIGRFRDWVGPDGARGAPVAALHSGLTAAQRHAQWSAVATGRARVVVGARSAIFAPFPATVRLGLIVVDEEHDEAYKQDQLPRYHARDVAVKRAQLEGCAVVLGSATPSLESWKNASEGRYTLHELPERVGGARLPRVEVVDLAQERRSRPWTDQRVHLLGPRLEREIGKALDSGGQVILLLNRRGWGNYICCPDHRCGWVLACDSCDAAMVYHRSRLAPAGGVVRCHHCLRERTLPPTCPTCERKVTVFGMGTQRIEEELARVFPGLIAGETMLRLDSDTTRTGRQWLGALEKFARGEARVLVGTQMIAKGLDFPGVRLVGVVNADTALNLPDFRSAERTFQLVSQVAGRAGRPHGEDGATHLVVVQTFAPTSAPIRLAAAHDYVAFVSDELAVRKRAGLPPFSRMARIVVRDRDHAKAMAHAREIEAALHEAIADGGGTAVRLRGPMPCPISRVNDFHRLAIELMAPAAGDIQRVIAAARARGLLKSDAHTAVDVDPVALL